MEVETALQRRRREQLQNHLREAIDRIVETETGWVFERPVNMEKFPDYLDLVERPMHLAAMRDKVVDGQYATLGEFRTDFDLVVNNCLKYFAEDTMFYKAAMKLKLESAFILTQLCERIERNITEEESIEETLSLPSPAQTTIKHERETTPITNCEELGDEINNDADNNYNLNADCSEATSVDLSLQEQRDNLMKMLKKANAKYTKVLTERKLTKNSKERKALFKAKMSIQTRLSNVSRRLKHEDTMDDNTTMDDMISVTTANKLASGSNVNTNGDESYQKTLELTSSGVCGPRRPSQGESQHLCSPLSSLNEKNKSELEQLLVAEVQRRPALWDKRIKANAQSRRELWCEIGTIFNINNAKERWNYMLAKFKYYHKSFCQQFPQIKDLAAANEDTVDKLVSQMKGHRRFHVFAPMRFVHPFMPKYNFHDKKLKKPHSSTSSSSHASDGDEKQPRPNFTHEMAMRTLKRPRRHSQQEDNVLSKIQRLDDRMSERMQQSPSKDDTYRTFGEHVGDLASCVPSHLLPQCMRFVTSITYSFMDSKVPKVIFP